MATEKMPASIGQSKPRRAAYAVEPGAVVGRWAVLAAGGRAEHWLCRCSCGTEREVRRANLRRGSSVSCGCVGAERLVELNGQKPGATKRPEYNVWIQMKGRCCNKRNGSFADYGGRGITICPEWLESFSVFFAQMGPRPTKWYMLERKDNDGPYCLDNCIWALPIVQANNKRNNKIITAFGRKMTQAQWAREMGLPVKTLFERLNRGWEVERALSVPVGKARSGRSSS